MGQQTGAGVFGIGPEAVEQAARVIADLGGDLHGTGRRLQLTGGPPRSALPGGLAAVALAAAAVRVGGAAAGEGAAATADAESLRRYVSAVTTADRESAADLGGCRS